MRTSVTMDAKLPNAFTVKNGHLAATSLTSISKNAETFRKAGFTHVLSLQKGVDTRAIEAAGMKWLGLVDIPDFKPATREHRAKFYAILDSLPADARLVIHCTAGQGRSPMLLAIALVHKYNYTPDAAIAEVKTSAMKMRGIDVIETPEQHQAVHEAMKDKA